MDTGSNGFVVITGEDNIRAVSDLAAWRAWGLHARFKIDGGSFKAHWTIAMFNESYGTNLRSWVDVDKHIREVNKARREAAK